MHDEELRADLAHSLETVRPELTPALEARAVAAVTAARAKPARPRRRLIAAATAAVVVLAGLGFVPIPLGKTKGALDRALATASNARTVHVLTRDFGRGAFEWERWVSEDGFSRSEWRQPDQPTQISLDADGWEVLYSVGRDGRTSDGDASYDPCALYPVPMPDRVEFFKRRHTHSLASARHRPAPTPQTREFRETSLWGGEVDVFEERTVVEDRTWRSQAGLEAQPLYDKGDTCLTRAEFDAQTGSLLSEREYRLRGDDRQLMTETTYEWNVEIPKELRQFTLSPGQKLTRTGPWESRAQHVIARGSTKDWVFTLHAIDVDRRGEILLWVSRVPTPDQNPDIYNSAPAMKVEAVGSDGARYTQDSGFSCMNSRYVGYWTTTLKPQFQNSQPARITLKIWPYASEPCEDQLITFQDIALPPRESINSFDELWVQEREVIQY